MKRNAADDAISRHYVGAVRDRFYGEGLKRLRHPILGEITMEYSAFAVDGRPDLCMVVYNPVSRADADRIRSLVISLPVQA